MTPTPAASTRVPRAVRQVVPVVAVLHHHRQPRRPPRELLDLDRLVEDDAVRAQPAAAADRLLQHRRVSRLADVGLRVDGQGQSLPGRHLPPRHVEERALRGGAVGERARPVARVPLAPEAVHHEVRELEDLLAVRLRRQQVDELGEGALELGIVVARLHALGPGLSAAPPQGDERTFVWRKSGRASRSGWISGFESWTRKATRSSVAARGVERHRPHRVRGRDGPGRRLHVAPVAADVEDVHEGQARERLDRVLQACLAAPHGQRGTVLFPGVADEARPEVADGRGRRGGGGHRVPALVLLDAERALIEPVRGDRRRRERRRHAVASRRPDTQRQRGPGLDELAAPRHGRGTTGRISAEGCAASWYTVCWALTRRVDADRGSPVFGLRSKRGKLLLETYRRRRWPALKTLLVAQRSMA